MFKSKLFFPDSDYLANKWWHRLATVIFWSWLILVLVGLLASVVSILDDYSGASAGVGLGLAFALCAAAVFFPSIVYRTVLFICLGSSWKEQRHTS
jgi:hypothetical protein